MELSARYSVRTDQLQSGNLLDFAPGFGVAAPVGLDQHGGAMAVLAVNQQIFIAQQIDQGQEHGEKHHHHEHQDAAGKEAAWQQRVPAGTTLHAALPSGTKT